MLCYSLYANKAVGVRSFCAWCDCGMGYPWGWSVWSQCRYLLGFPWWTPLQQGPWHSLEQRKSLFPSPPHSARPMRWGSPPIKGPTESSACLVQEAACVLLPIFCPFQPWSVPNMLWNTHVKQNTLCEHWAWCDACPVSWLWFNRKWERIDFKMLRRNSHFLFP